MNASLETSRTAPPWGRLVLSLLRSSLLLAAVLATAISALAQEFIFEPAPSPVFDPAFTLAAHQDAASNPSPAHGVLFSSESDTVQDVEWTGASLGGGYDAGYSRSMPRGRSRRTVAFSQPGESQVPSVDPLQPSEPERLLPQQGEGKQGSTERRIGADQKIGQAPEETRTNLQFLRDQSILLDPGQYQFEVRVQYLIDESDFVLVTLEDDVLTIGEARRRLRLLTVPLELRVGIAPDTQAFVNVPFGWSNNEVAFAGVDEFSNVGGIGDVNAGLIHQFFKEKDRCPAILGSIGFSAPTGNASIATSLSTPTGALGEGFWTLSLALTAIHTFDPVVVFYGFGYRHRFNDSIDGIPVTPGKQAFYRLGTGFAVNQRVTFSAEFSGSYIGRDKIRGVPVEGSLRELINVRLATTIVTQKQPKKNHPVRFVEPFVNFGLTDEAIDTVFGVGWTR